MERRAYICLRCDPVTRVFVSADDQEPRCPQHGRMTRQTNVPYRPSPPPPPGRTRRPRRGR